MVLTKGHYTALIAKSPSDLDAGFALRTSVFRGQTAGFADSPDRDTFDKRCSHIIVKNTTTGETVAYFRTLLLPAAAISDSYAGQFYNLGNLHSFPSAVLEIGRFCTTPDGDTADILRLAWSMLTQIVETYNVGLLFGCSSFQGTDPAPYSAALTLLSARHLAPAEYAPKRKARNTIPYAANHEGRTPNLKQALSVLPPFLRTYLAMGGWVSDHAVIDQDLGTFHVFTGVEIAKIPAKRAAILRGENPT